MKKLASVSLAALAFVTANSAWAQTADTSTDNDDTDGVAAAKCRVSEASVIVAGIAHAVHGAIGVTAEFDLQLYSRRLKQGQVAFGSENYWADQLARARISSAVESSASFIRSRLAD